MKRSDFLILCGIFLVLSVSFVFADDITGKATSQSATVNITIQNNAPVVDWVSVIPSQDPTEDGTNSVLFYFTVSDPDGIANIDNSSAQAQFNLTGETTRTNSSCQVVGALNLTRVNYSCTIDIWYFDGAGTWTINSTITDNNGETTSNISTSFSLTQLTAITMTPSALAWSSISVTDTDTLADNNPLLINNTGNDDIATGNVQVTAIDLAGEVNPSYFIYSGNFTSNIASACNTGTTLVNATATGITNSVLAAGNHTVNDGSTGQEQLYFCLEAMNADLIAQSYSTATLGAWTVGVI